MWREFAESSRPSDMGLGNTYVLAQNSLALVSVFKSLCVSWQPLYYFGLVPLSLVWIFTINDPLILLLSLA